MESILPEELYADLVLLNGKVITVDAHDSIVEAVACKGEKIIKACKTEEIKAYVGKNTEVIDLEGKTVTPGFIDSHSHFSSGGRRVRKNDLRYVRSMDELISKLKEKADRTQVGRWI